MALIQENDFKDVRQKAANFHAVVIDDDPASLKVTSWLLRRGGYRVSELSDFNFNADELVASIGQPVDVFVIDYTLETCNAPAILQTLDQSAVYHSTKKIVISSHRTRAIEQLAFEYGANDYITKPLNKLTFANRVLSVHSSLNQIRFDDTVDTDVLTGLDTRLGLFKLAHDGSALFNSAYSVIIFKIANLEKTNTVAGRDCGDVIIKTIAERLRISAPQNSYLARISSARFVLILQTDSEDYLDGLFRTIKYRLEQVIRLGERELYAVIEAGSKINRTKKSLEESIDNATIALIFSQSKEPNTLTVFNPTIRQSLHRNVLIENAIYSGELVRNLTMHYQPQVNLANKRIKGFEALMRFNSPSIGSVSALELISVLENSSAIHEVGLQIFKLVFEDLPAFDPSCTIAVNLSPVQLENVELLKRIKELVHRYRINCHRVELEITETACLSMSETSKLNLQGLAEMGFSLVLDDFGVGYSNLDYLISLPIRKVKVDSIFTRDISSVITKQNIMRGLVHLCALEGIELLAEGVENEEQNQTLIDIKVSSAQGYYYGKAMP